MNDSIIKTLSVAFAVCLVCSLFVSFAAVNLRDTQNLNKINDQRVKVLQAAGIYDEANTNIEEQFSSISRDLQDCHTFAPLEAQNLRKFLSNFFGDKNAKECMKLRLITAHDQIYSSCSKKA